MRSWALLGRHFKTLQMLETVSRDTNPVLAPNAALSCPLPMRSDSRIASRFRVNDTRPAAGAKARRVRLCLSEKARVG